MVRKVHGRPPEPHSVEDVNWEQLREDGAHEEGLKRGPTRVERWESTKNNGRSVKARGVEIHTEQLIDGLESSGIPSDRVVGRSQSIGVLVPWRRAGEDCLDQDSNNVHISERASPDWQSARRTPDEHASADDDR